MPLSTLHPAPRGAQRKTRGQDGSLLLSCGALSSPTARRFIPTIALAGARGSEWAFRAVTARESGWACGPLILMKTRSNADIVESMVCGAFSGERLYKL